MPITRFEVRVAAGASRQFLKIEGGGERIRITVTQHPERGKANRAVINLLAKMLDVTKPQVRIVRGTNARDKLVQVEGLSFEEAMGRLAIGL